MRSRLITRIDLMQKRDKSYSSFLFLSVFIFLQSILFIPVTGQNGISALQSNPDRTEVSVRRSHNKPVSLSFLKVFLQLNNSCQNSDQHEIVWLQNQLKYSKKVDQSLLFLRYPDHRLPAFFIQNIYHANQDKNSAFIC